MTKNCARNSLKIMGFSGLHGTCVYRPRTGSDNPGNYTISQTEHTILTEEQVQSRVTGMLLVRILVKEPALPRLSLS